MSITFKEALSSRSANKFAKWPSRDDNRLEPSAEPSFNSGISIEKGSKILTMGSCFARNIEEYLGNIGYDVPVLGYDGPAVEYGGGGRIQGILNKYTVASICQEFEWLVRVSDKGGIVDWSHVEDMVFEVGDDQFIDLQLSSSYPVSARRLIERRQQIYDISIQFFNCDLAIITPGLTEAWLDTKTGRYIQQPPKKAMLQADPTRYQFEVLDFFKCFEMLEKIVNILKTRGTKQVAFTVSPVPLSSTFTTQDVLIANTYSKATLRSAIGLLVERHESVYYIPSFERVMLTKGREVWDDDLRHVSKGFVGSIVQRFAEASSVGARETSTASLVAGFFAAWSSEDMVRAEEILITLGPRALDVEIPAFHSHAIKLFMQKEDTKNGLLHARSLQRINPKHVKGYVWEMNIHSKAQDLSGLQESVDRALANCSPQDHGAFDIFSNRHIRPGLSGSIGRFLVALGRRLSR